MKRFNNTYICERNAKPYIENKTSDLTQKESTVFLLKGKKLQNFVICHCNILVNNAVVINNTIILKRQLFVICLNEL